MRKALYIAILALVLGVGVNSCSDGTIGETLDNNKIEIVKDSTFAIKAYSVKNDTVISRTTTQLLGHLAASGYGTLRSDFVTQFMPSFFIDTTNLKKSVIDSLVYTMAVTKNTGFVGDSIVPMRVSVYALNKQLPNPIYTTFDPTDYYNTSDLIGEKSYTATAVGLGDSLKKLSYREINVKLSDRLSKSFFNEYCNNPSTFNTPTAFAEFFPGVYVKSTFGTGRVMKIESSGMRFYYHYTTKTSAGNDTIISNSQSFLGVSPEITTNSIVSLDVASSLESRVEAGEAIIVAPTGYNVRVDLPIQEMVNTFLGDESKTLSVLSQIYLEIPCETLTVDYSIAPPASLLLIPQSEMKEFFLKSKISDDETSFIATYDSTKKVYTVSNMRKYLIKLINKRNAGTAITEEDSQFILTPVTVISETSTSGTTTTVTSNRPFMEGPAVVKLLPDKAKLRMTFTRETFAH